MRFSKSSPTLRDFDLTLNTPDGVTLSQFIVSFGHHSIVSTAPNDDVTLQVPENLPDEVRISVVAGGSSADGTVHSAIILPGSAAGLDLRFASPPSVQAPGTGANLPASGVFSYSRGPGTVAMLNFSYTVFDPDNESMTPMLTAVYTDDATVPLSRLLALDLDLPAGELIDWSVTANGGNADVDDVVDPAVRQQDTRIIASAPQRTFTR